MAIRAFLFDFGGVFTDSPFAAVEDYGRSLGADPALVAQLVFGSYAEDGPHPWHRLERGEITLENARGMIRELGAAHSLDIDIFEMFGRMARSGAGVGARQALVERVRGLCREGYHTGIVTNNVREFGEAWRALIPVEELFGFVIDSCHAGVRKPDWRIFELALAELSGIEARECVFLDDHAGNVRAASALGMTGVHVGPDPAETVAAIDALTG